MRKPEHDINYIYNAIICSDLTILDSDNEEIKTIKTKLVEVKNIIDKMGKNLYGADYSKKKLERVNKAKYERYLISCHRDKERRQKMHELLLNQKLDNA